MKGIIMFTKEELQEIYRMFEYAIEDAYEEDQPTIVALWRSIAGKARELS